MLSTLRRFTRFYRQSFSGLPKEIWLLCSGLLINRAGTMVLPFLALYATEELELSKIEAGWLLSAFGLGSIVGSFSGGRLSDVFGPVRIQLASLVGGGIGFLLVGQAKELWPLMLAVFGASAVSEAFRPACMTAVIEAAPEGLRTRALALLRLAANVGMALGPATGGILASYGYHWIFVGDALTCWLAAVVLWRRLDGETVRRAGRTVAVVPARVILRDRPFLGLLAIVFLMVCALFQFAGTLPVYLHDAFHLDERQIGLVLGLNALLIVISEMPLVHGLERRSPTQLIGLGCFLTCTGYALMPLGSGLPFLCLTVAVWTTGEMMAFPFSNSYAAHRAGTAAGAYMGLYTATFSCAFLVAPLVGFTVYERFGPETLWLGIGILGPLLWLASLLLPRQETGREPLEAPSAQGLQQE